MARASTKEDKTVYQIRREELGLSRDKASILLIQSTEQLISDNKPVLLQK